MPDPSSEETAVDWYSHDLDDVNKDEEEANRGQQADVAVPQQQQQFEPPPAVPLKLSDPPSLWLSEEETDNALAIKDAIEGMPDLDNLSDFMYAHMAIAGKGDVEWAIERAYKLQAVKEEYKIKGTYEEGVRAILDSFQLYPDYHMAYSFNPHDGNAELVMDFTKMGKKSWRIPEKIATKIRGCYYICHATFPSFETVRVGNVHIFECMGYDWKMDMVDLKMFGKISEESHGSFPSHIRQTRFYNTPSMLNILVSMARRLVPGELSGGWKVGCQFAGGRLDQFYMLPDKEAASQKCYATLCEALRIRYECEQRFSLEDD